MEDNRISHTEKGKSISKNVIISLINTFVSMAFPLITYPYISRVLQVDNIGSINFGMSIIEYFGVIAAFGISGFAVRNGSAIKNDAVKLQKFVTQVFSINIVTTAISFSLLLIMLLCSKQLNGYSTIILIQSITLLVSPLTIEWLYSIYEDFVYIAVRNLLVKLVSLAAVFIFVKSENDVLLYVLITALSTAIASVINFVHSRKYIHIGFTFKNCWNAYKSTLIIFLINSIASTIYLNSDKTMLGIFCDDKSVGLYSTATNIYMIVKRIVAAGVLVIIPRLSYYFQNNDKEFHDLVNKALRIVVIISIPMMVGLILLAPETIYIISGKGYENAKKPLIVLAIATVFATLANLFSNGILIAQKKEKMVMRCTVISSIINISLNFFMIPMFRETGAAITTLIAEIVMATMSIWYSKIKFWSKTVTMTLVKTIVSTIVLTVACIGISMCLININIFIRTVAVVLGGILSFLIMEYLLQEEVLISVLNRFTNKVIR